MNDPIQCRDCGRALLYGRRCLNCCRKRADLVVERLQVEDESWKQRFKCKCGKVIDLPESMLANESVACCSCDRVYGYVPGTGPTYIGNRIEDGVSIRGVSIMTPAGVGQADVVPTKPAPGHKPTHVLREYAARLRMLQPLPKPAAAALLDVLDSVEAMCERRPGDHVEELRQAAAIRLAWDNFVLTLEIST